MRREAKNNPTPATTRGLPDGENGSPRDAGQHHVISAGPTSVVEAEIEVTVGVDRLDGPAREPARDRSASIIVNEHETGPPSRYVAQIHTYRAVAQSDASRDLHLAVLRRAVDVRHER